MLETLAAVDKLLLRVVTESSAWVALPLFFVAGGAVGVPLAAWIDALVHSGPGDAPFFACRVCGQKIGWLHRVPLVGPLLSGGRCPGCGTLRRQSELLVQWGTGLLFAALAAALLDQHCQAIPEQGNPAAIHWRLLFQLVLVSLLIVAAGVDLKCYLIPDAITLPGLAVGLTAATLHGNLQLLPLWVDWNGPMVELYGQYIPDWIKLHSHWHGLAWSLAGAAAGAAITWGVRVLGGWLLGVEALGFGDVTLMAMIGSFVGWQPIVFIFPLAAVGSLCAGLLLKIARARSAMPYGPALSAATLAVLMSWRWLWTPLRTLFGHWPTLLLLGAVFASSLVALLGLLRIYRRIPVERRIQNPVDETPPP